MLTNRQNNDFMKTKQELRQYIRTLKKAIPLDEKKLRSSDIWRRALEISEIKNAKTILLYWSMDDEVYTHDVVQLLAKNKTVLLPVVDGNDLRIKQFRGLENMRAGEQFGIGEPTGDDFSGDIDVIVVPGVAFDRECNRMGRGRGFYDRLLKRQNATCIGVAFDFQLFDKIPTEPFDVKMDCVVNEKETVSLKRVELSVDYQ